MDYDGEGQEMELVEEVVGVSSAGTLRRSRSRGTSPKRVRGPFRPFRQNQPKSSVPPEPHSIEEPQIATPASSGLKRIGNRLLPSRIRSLPSRPEETSSSAVDTNATALSIGTNWVSIQVTETDNEETTSSYRDVPQEISGSRSTSETGKELSRSQSTNETRKTPQKISRSRSTNETRKASQEISKSRSTNETRKTRQKISRSRSKSETRKIPLVISRSRSTNETRKATLSIPPKSRRPSSSTKPQYQKSRRRGRSPSKKKETKKKTGRGRHELGKHSKQPPLRRVSRSCPGSVEAIRTPNNEVVTQLTLETDETSEESPSIEQEPPQHQNNGEVVKRLEPSIKTNGRFTKMNTPNKTEEKLTEQKRIEKEKTEPIKTQAKVQKTEKDETKQKKIEKIKENKSKRNVRKIETEETKQKTTELKKIENGKIEQNMNSKRNVQKTETEETKQKKTEQKENTYDSAMALGASSSTKKSKMVLKSFPFTRKRLAKPKPTKIAHETASPTLATDRSQSPRTQRQRTIIADQHNRKTNMDTSQNLHSPGATSFSSVITATIVKKTASERTGLFFKRSSNGGKLQVTKVAEGSLFESTPLRAGDEIIAINNIKKSERTSREMADLIRKTEGAITILAWRDNLQEIEDAREKEKYEEVLTDVYHESRDDDDEDHDNHIILRKITSLELKPTESSSWDSDPKRVGKYKNLKRFFEKQRSGQSVPRNSGDETSVFTVGGETRTSVSSITNYHIPKEAGSILDVVTKNEALLAEAYGQCCGEYDDEFSVDVPLLNK